jgi:hypothetical protein
VFSYTQFDWKDAHIIILIDGQTYICTHTPANTYMIIQSHIDAYVYVHVHV